MKFVDFCVAVRQGAPAVQLQSVYVGAAAATVPGRSLVVHKSTFSADIGCRANQPPTTDQSTPLTPGRPKLRPRPLTAAASAL